MSLTAKLRRAPIRAVTGVYILNSGLDKFSADEETSKSMHGFAAGAYPVVQKVDHTMFIKGLGVAEVALGSALLLPIAPPAAVGLGLMAFSGGLIGLYWRTPGLHRGATDPRPTHDGVAIAKDSWLLGAGATLVLDALLDNAREKRLELTHGMATAAAVGAERARGRSREAKARARDARRLAQARAAEARANAKAKTASQVAKTGAYVNTAKGMARTAKAATEKVVDAVR